MTVPKLTDPTGPGSYAWAQADLVIRNTLYGTKNSVHCARYRMRRELRKHGADESVIADWESDIAEQVKELRGTGERK